MQLTELKQNLANLREYLSAQEIGKSIMLLKKIIRYFPNEAMYYQVDEVESTYINLLNYTVVLGIEDPKRVQIQQQLLRNLYDLSDEICYQLESRSGRFHLELEYFRHLQTSDLTDVIREITGQLTRPFQELHSVSDAAEQKEIRNQLVIKLFAILWLSRKLSQEQCNILKKYFQSDAIPWHEKCLMVSAITLSLTDRFDALKLEMLFDIFEMGEFQVSQRAFVGLILSLNIHDARSSLYPGIVGRLKTFGGEDYIEKNLLMMLMQMGRANETDNIIRRFREEILPEIMKQAPKIEEKLGLQQMLSDDPEETKNPSWKSFFEDNPDLMSRLEEITRMQLEGMDVFLNTFVHLKHFRFFDDIINWFIPFHRNQDDVKAIISSLNLPDVDLFIEGLEKSGYICNSDKYSFCLSLQAMPSQQRQTMIQMLTGEMEGMMEMAEEENKLNPRQQVNFVFIQYIQDLYRFFKLHPQRKEFSDVFASKFDFYQRNSFRYLIASEKSLRMLGDFFFERNRFDDAIAIYQQASERFEANQELYEKIAYCFEKQHDFEKAITFYQKAELFEPNRIWNLKRLAHCYIQTGKTTEAIRCFEDMLLLEPDNLQAMLGIGRCYLKMKDYEKAQRHFLEVAGRFSSNISALRPAAWCLFVNGNLEEADEYYSRIRATGPSRHDLMNHGHVFWCKGYRKQAIDCYQKSIELNGGDFEPFEQGFRDDMPFLIRQGADADELLLALDYLRLSHASLQ